MTNQHNLKLFIVTALLTVMALLGGTVTTASAHLLTRQQASCEQHCAHIQINGCHLPDKAALDLASANGPSIACHHRTAAPRDLNYPRYERPHKTAYIIFQESRTPLPQLKTGQPFFNNYPVKQASLFPHQTLLAQREALLKLRSDVLRH